LTYISYIQIIKIEKMNKNVLKHQ